MLVKLLKLRGISYDDKISPYLPSHWKQGLKARNVAFRAILSHQGGFWDSHCTFDELQRHIEQASPGIAEGWHYSNTNYALMRILIPILSGNIDPGTTFDGASGTPSTAKANGVFWDAYTRKYFEAYCQSQLWQPADVHYASLKSNHNLRDTPPFNGMEQITNASLAYPYPSSNTVRGSDISADSTSISGAVGWHLSTDEMLKGAAAIRRGRIIPRAAFREMCDANLGLFTSHTDVGPFHYHAGTWTGGGGHGHVAFLGFLPGNREVAILSNQKRDTDGRALRSLSDVVRDAYVAATTP